MSQKVPAPPGDTITPLKDSPPKISKKLSPPKIGYFQILPHPPPSPPLHQGGGLILRHITRGLVLIVINVFYLI